MKTILEFGFDSYDTLYHRLPPATIPDEFGAPAMSWRGPIYALSKTASSTRATFELPVAIDKAWFAPENRLAASLPCVFFCFQTDAKGRPSASPTILAITGKGTAFDDSRSYRFAEIPHDTILLIEAHGTAISWLEPGDIHLSDIDRFRNSVSHPHGQHVGFADGTVWCISLDAPTSEVAKLCTLSGAAEFDRDTILGRYRL